MKTEYIIWIVTGIWVVIYAVAIAPIMNIWMKAVMGGVNIPFMRVVGMKMKKINPEEMVATYIKATQAKTSITLDELETHHLAGGNISKAVSAYIQVRHRDIDIPFSVICSTDLAGYNLDEIDPDKFREIKKS